MKKIKTFADACKKLGIDPNKLPDVTGLDEQMGKHLIATYKLTIIRDAIVGEWKADYSNGSQRKWFPWFRYDSSLSAFRFFGSDYSIRGATGVTGARLCFETEEQADYIGQQFLPEFNEILLIK